MIAQPLTVELVLPLATTMLATPQGQRSNGAHADNPIIQTRFTADPEPPVHDSIVA